MCEHISGTVLRQKAQVLTALAAVLCLEMDLRLDILEYVSISREPDGAEDNW